MHAILDRTTTLQDAVVGRVLDASQILEMRHIARAVPIAQPVQSYAVRLTLGTHAGSPYATPMVGRYVRYGASPRAAQALVLAGKIRALCDGRPFVSVEDIRAAALPALRHRVLLNFDGEAGQIDPDAIIEELVATLKAE